jgi:hypothetical protein
VRPRQVRYQAALRPDSIASLILNHFQKRHHYPRFRFTSFLVQTVSKLCQNPSVHPCVITDVLIDLLIDLLIKVLLVRLPIQLH